MLTRDRWFFHFYEWRTMLEKAHDGSRVTVHYTGRLADGTIFDSSLGGDPMSFILGEKDLIKGFEDTVTGMAIGERKTVTIPAEDAYGPHRDDLVVTVERTQIPGELDLSADMKLRIRRDDGDIEVLVTSISESGVTLDANHPLAGEDLVFDIELISLS